MGGQREDGQQSRLMSIWSSVIAPDLLQRLQKNDPDVVAVLNRLYPESKHPTLTPSKHCVFCHRKYDPRDTSICKVKHFVDDTHTDHHQWYSSCVTCGESFSANFDKYDDDEWPDEMITGYCHKGPHCNDVSVRREKWKTPENKQACGDSDAGED
eukprot:JP436780.1.p1 GENE.JP436780.1~~JP436780.1.p1  ORF type:complete len:155 (+),score=21.66 JP436780.1:1-465(+)